MSTEVREVLLEVYLNGAFYCRESYWASDDKDVQLEFEITNAIYDLLGCSASQEIDVQLEFETDDHVSVGHCSPGEMHMELETDENQNISVCEVKDLQLEMNRNVSVSELKKPALVSEDLRDPAGPSVEDSGVQENSPTESTAGWMFKKISAVFQQLTAIFQTNALNAVGKPEVDLLDPEESFGPDPSIPDPEPKVDLVDPEESFGPDPSISKQEPEVNLVDTEQSCIPEPEMDLLDSEESCLPDPSIPEPEPEMNLVDIEQSCVPDPSAPGPGPEVDLVDPEESCAPGPSVPEPEPEVTSEHLSLENCIRLNVSKLEDRLRECTVSKTPVTEVWPRVFIGNEETAWDRDQLKEMGITHILNAAAPKKDLKFLLGMASEKDLLGTVNTGSRYYRGMNMTYCGLPSFRHWANISKYFLPAAKFIHKALRNPRSKVLIHCTQGLSHSATLFLAYLMICHDMMVEEAIDHVIKVRCIKPYFGHLKHLAFLNADLVLQRNLKLQGGKTDKKMNKWQVKTKFSQINHNWYKLSKMLYRCKHKLIILTQSHDSSFSRCFDRAIVGRRFFFLQGMLYLYRMVTMYITTLPVPSMHMHCAPKPGRSGGVFHHLTSLLLVPHHGQQPVQIIDLSVSEHHTMSTEVREVLLEVYLNGAFYCRESYWASDDKDVQLEFEITNAIYDLLGCSASQEIDVQLEFETDDHVSVGHCSPGEMHMELETDENQNISVCEVKDLQLEMNRNVSVSELKKPALVSEDLRDPAGPSVEDSGVQENSPTESTAGWMFKKISAVFQQLTAIFQTNALNAVGEPEVDLLDPEESFGPDPSISKQEPEVNLVDIEQQCVPDPSVPDPEPEVDLLDTEKSFGPDPSIPDPEPKVDLVDPEESFGPDPSISKQEPEVNLVDTEQSCIPEPEMDLLDSEESCLPDPSIPEPEPEMNLVDIEQSCVPDPSAPGPGPEVDLVDPEESCAPGPSVPEPEPEVTSEHLSLENCIRLNVSKLEDRLRECTLSKTPVTEVWPRVFIGNEETAWDRNKLKEMGITHILNAAAPKKDLKFLLGMASEKDLLGTVNTGSRYYRGMNMTYCGLPSFRHWANISKYFLPAAKFIHKALRNPTSKVLIHCTQGLSHSATLFLAYLMICHDMMVEEAIDHVIKVRCIKPYFGHLKHLAFLNADLVLQRNLKLQGGKSDKKMNKWQVKTK
ncbi:uncharacterized protein LOC113065309 [Carassius auratus]|uniref:Uncharacterized protein LOC113065309 n=1 Tax=Carassius auratus TaxID=7957 RepID=A0A6P6M8W4_CARAU|nr:uncharacterized protein LOC113065309 [Carassius auratus]